VAEVDAEARYQVRRLRSHPCMALWCGNNENQWIHDQRNWQTPEQPVPGARYYHALLPAIVAEHDARTPYWPGSPYAGDDYNSTADGDTHNWHVWHGLQPRRFGTEPAVDRSPEGVAFRHYAEDMGRFISEFGMHAAPVFETLRRVIPADQRYHHSPAMDHHNKDTPKNKGDNLMLPVTGLPDDLPTYIDYSMIAQAEGLKFGIEHYRRRKPHCSGTLIWQLNDCWPVLSWSLIDYYGFGKAGYFYTRRVYAAVLASFKPRADGGVELWITNDTRAPLADTVHVQLGTFDGQVIWAEQRAVAVPANSSQAVCCWEAGAILARPDAYLAVRSGDACFPANRHFFAPIKDLQLVPEAKPRVTIAARGANALDVELSADAWLLMVSIGSPQAGVRYSDNYFDLRPGERRVVRVAHAQQPIAAGDLTIRCWNQGT
jgi:beta-mannosidase